MVCSNCGHEQNTGSVCEKCEHSIEHKEEIVHDQPEEVVNEGKDVAEPQEAKAEVAATKVQPVNNPDVYVQKVKEKSKQYWNYFLHYIKNPSKILESANSEWVNALISIGIFVFFISWIPLLYARNFMRGYGFGGLGEVAGFFIGGFISIFIFTVLSIAVVTFSLFIINKFFGPGYSFKDIISHYGALITPVLIVILLSFLLVLIRSQFVGAFLLSVVLMLALMIIPLYLIGRYLAKEAKLIDPFYGFLLYIVLNAILFSIVSMILMDTTAGIIFDELF